MVNKSITVDSMLNDAERTYGLIGKLLRETTYFTEIHGGALVGKVMEIIIFIHSICVDIRTLLMLSFVGIVYGFYHNYSETKQTVYDIFSPLPNAMIEIWTSFCAAIRTLYHALISKEFVQFLVTLIIIFTLRDIIAQVVVLKSSEMVSRSK
jgi:hypothetical protein